MHTQITSPESNALARICREWYVSFGVVTGVILLSLWVHPLWMPLYELVLAVALALLGTGRKASSHLPCGRITMITVYTLIITGLISFFINVAYHTEFIHLIFDISTLNRSIPYITSLIIFPVCFVLTLFLNSRAVYALHVRNCHLHNQYNPEQPMFGRIVHATYRSLLKRLTVICGIICVVDWAYYFLYYKNVSLNSPDRFFFFVVPAAIYLWSIFYVRNSYSSLVVGNGRIIRANAQEPETKVNAVRNSQIIRYLVLHEDRLLLNVSEQALLSCNVDTPVIQVFHDPSEPSFQQAESTFQRLSGLTHFKIRLLYNSHDPLNNNSIHHFLVSIPTGETPDALDGEWVPVDGIDRIIKMGVAAPPFADEIHRVYTITMAWKTYHSDGRRRFPIRNYRPNFRLEDIEKCQADYNDNHWFKVWRNNEDQPFWFLRRFRLKRN